MQSLNDEILRLYNVSKIDDMEISRRNGENKKVNK